MSKPTKRQVLAAKKYIREAEPATGIKSKEGQDVMDPSVAADGRVRDGGIFPRSDHSGVDTPKGELGGAPLEGSAQDPAKEAELRILYPFLDEQRWFTEFIRSKRDSGDHRGQEYLIGEALSRVRKLAQEMHIHSAKRMRDMDQSGVDSSPAAVEGVCADRIVAALADPGKG